MRVEPQPEVIQFIVSEAKRAGQSVGIVPTMGALHAGHVSLIEAARTECDFVVVTIFVNPTQFAPGEDFEKYPRTLDDDLRQCEQAGADVVFTPEAATMYGTDAQTVVRVSQLTQYLEGAQRPTHFEGVTTVVAKLFNITLPDRAYFGQKDYQQQLIIQQMVKDLNWPLQVVCCPIVREPDGLALSSRNRYLSDEQRRQALILRQALDTAERLADDHQSAAEIETAMQQLIAGQDGVELEYALVRNSETLAAITESGQPRVALVAARLGQTRLIDNTLLPPEPKALR
jgi:pantoate--beta-alanine ligase